jgi:L-rhamnose mutarotase
MGQVIQVRPEKLDEYKRLHADAWPGVLSMIKKCNIRNYTIFFRDNVLYSYFEYTGNSYESDMKKMAEDPETRRWWSITDTCQKPVDSAAPGEWWAPMEEVFHCD